MKNDTMKSLGKRLARHHARVMGVGTIPSESGSNPAFPELTSPAPRKVKGRPAAEMAGFGVQIAATGETWRLEQPAPLDMGDPDDSIAYPIGERQTVPIELVGKWLAWSPDRLRIVGHGETIAEAREMGGGSRDLVISCIQRSAIHHADGADILSAD